jgi:V/A-type H+-transporting ATPase subunit I
MSLRPAAANWFELLVMREDLATAVDVLAKSQRVELQSYGETKVSMLMPECRELLEEFDELEHRFERYWPAARPRQPEQRDEPYRMLQQGLDRLRRWGGATEEIVVGLEQLENEHNDLLLLAAMFREGDALPNMGQFASAGPMLRSCLFLLPPGEWPEAIPGNVIVQRIATPDHGYLLALGLPEEIGTLEQHLHLQKARLISLPDVLPESADNALREIDDRLQRLSRRIAELEVELLALHERYDVADALADARFVRWYVSSVPELSATENFAWVTGWTSEMDGESLLATLSSAGIKSLLRVTTPPSGIEAPMLLRNPKWMRPFELFASMLGVPAAGEADPTRILAIASPLIFGYMFGDVGHGMVLFIAGLILGRRYPALRLLTYGGAMSVLFGFLFGSVFALDNVIEPLWIHPFDQPVLILLLPVAGGAALLLVGMCLDGLQAWWRQKSGDWWATSAGLTLCYIALLATIWDRQSLWLALAGAAWFVAGHAVVATSRRTLAALSAAAEVLQSVLQLIVNTISFVRVGAFALAHAGLSLAFVDLADATPSVPGTLLVLLLGNVLIIGLEGLVVSIQTTRLVLFEFFVRFLRAEGRPFRPLAPLNSFSPREHRRPQ